MQHVLSPCCYCCCCQPADGVQWWPFIIIEVVLNAKIYLVDKEKVKKKTY